MVLYINQHLPGSPERCWFSTLCCDVGYEAYDVPLEWMDAHGDEVIPD